MNRKVATKVVQAPEGQENGQEEARALVDTEEDDRPLVDDWKAVPVEELGTALDAWLITSRKLASIKERINTKLWMAKGSKKGEATKFRDEAKKITEEMIPVREELEAMTWRMVELMVEHRALRENIDNWTRPGSIPRNLRMMLKRGLRTEGIDISEMVEQANSIEDEREKRALADADL